MDHSDTHIIGKILVIIFIIELLGILLSLVGSGTNNPTFTQFNTFSGNINQTSFNLVHSFNSTAVTTINPISTTPIVNQLEWIYNGLATIINIIYVFFSLIYNFFSLMIQMLILIGYVFFVAIPSLLISNGIIGYILALGYGFIVIFLGYKFGKIVISFVAIIIGGLKSVI